MFVTATKKFPTTNSEFYIVAVLNYTTDSFHDGGRYFNFAAAAERVTLMAAAGADIIDVGAESTRPGAVPVSADEEISRVTPLIKHIRATIPACVISIDTTKSAVASAALAAGAEIVNDISGLTMDPDMAATVINHQASVIINHMQGTPQTMQRDPRYRDVVNEVKQFLREQAAGLVARGLPAEKIMIDPGIGFGKTLEHNCGLLNHLDGFRDCGYEIMLGASRKSFIGGIIESTPGQRLPGTIAANVLAYQRGVRFFRVHDVAENRQALEVARRIITS